MATKKFLGPGQSEEEEESPSDSDNESSIYEDVRLYAKQHKLVGSKSTIKARLRRIRRMIEDLDTVERAFVGEENLIVIYDGHSDDMLEGILLQRTHLEYGGGFNGSSNNEVGIAYVIR